MTKNYRLLHLKHYYVAPCNSSMMVYSEEPSRQKILFKKRNCIKIEPSIKELYV